MARSFAESGSRALYANSCVTWVWIDPFTPAARESDTSSVKALRADVALGALAAAFASVSLTYPFGRDQGLFYYVGREWFLRGAIPYRDVFEQKTPFIFVVHGLLILLTGENMWAIRVAEIGAVLLIGLFASKVAASRGTTRPHGTAGAAMLAASTFYYGYFSFQDVGNCEVWCALFALASMVAARSIKRVSLACVVAGFLIGVGVVAKPPAIWFAPFAVYEIYRRAPGPLARHARNLALFGAGGAVVIGAVLLYFQERHALDSLIDVVFRANAHHAIHDSISLPVIAHRTWQRIDWFCPYSYFFFAVTVLATTFGIWRSDESLTRRYGFPLVLMVATYGAIAMQLKFYDYHYGLVLVPFSVFGATIYDDLFRSAPIRKSAIPLAFACTLIAIVTGTVPHDVWSDHAKTALALARGEQAWDKRAEQFLDGSYDAANSMRIGDWLRAHSSPDDSILVRGYEPEIYAFAERRFVGRFFWSAFLTHRSRIYRRAEWLAQDEGGIARFPPRFVVALGNTVDAIDSTRWFEERGYVTRQVFGGLVIMECNSPCGKKR